MVDVSDIILCSTVCKNLPRLVTANIILYFQNYKRYAKVFKILQKYNIFCFAKVCKSKAREKVVYHL